MMEQSDEEIVQKYGHPPVIEAFTPSSLNDYSRMSTRSGLVWDMGMLYVSVTDSEGQKYALNRGWEKTMSGLWLSCKLDADISRASPRLFKSQYTGPIRFDLDEEKQVANIKSWPSRHNFKVDIEVGKIHWEEESGAVNLDLKSLGTAMRYTDLGEGDYEGMIVTCEVFEVSGTINGEPVSGVGGMDNTWIHPGVGFTQSKLYTHIQNTWMAWVTRYDDGTIEHGVKGSGAGAWHWGFYVKDGKPILEKNYTADTTWGDADGVKIPLEVDIQYGDHNFKWEADGRMSLIKGNMNRVSGRVINTRKAAKPAETFSWIEFRDPDREVG